MLRRSLVVHHLLPARRLSSIHQRSSSPFFFFRLVIKRCDALGRPRECVRARAFVHVTRRDAGHRLAGLMYNPCRSKGNPSLLSMQPCLLSASAAAAA